jgi:hypothetical protein
MLGGQTAGMRSSLARDIKQAGTRKSKLHDQDGRRGFWRAY